MTEELVPQKVEDPAPIKSNNQFNLAALVSLLSGILTYIWLPITLMLDVSAWLTLVLSPLSALVAVIIGSRAKKNIRASQGQLSGRKMANWGLSLGWIFIIGSILVTVLAFVIGGVLLNSLKGLFS